MSDYNIISKIEPSGTHCDIVFVVSTRGYGVTLAMALYLTLERGVQIALICDRWICSQQPH